MSRCRRRCTAGCCSWGDSRGSVGARDRAAERRFAVPETLSELRPRGPDARPLDAEPYPSPAAGGFPRAGIRLGSVAAPQGRPGAGSQAGGGFERAAGEREPEEDQI